MNKNIPDFKDRPEQNFKLDKLKDFKNLPMELLYSLVGVLVFAGFILFLITKALV